MSKKSGFQKEINLMLGIPRSKQTTFELSKIDEKQMNLTIKKGPANLEDPWFGTSGKSEFALLPAELFEILIRSLKNAQKENFELKLERSIWQHIPVDFGDVWSVAIDEIKNGNFQTEPDINKIIDKIKKEHPNLFVDLKNLVTQNRSDA